MGEKGPRGDKKSAERKKSKADGGVPATNPLLITAEEEIRFMANTNTPSKVTDVISKFTLMRQDTQKTKKQQKDWKFTKNY